MGAHCVAQLSIYDTLCSSKNDARRTEADFDLSRFMLCVVGLSKSRQKDDSSGLPTIGKPRNGDSKTPCLTMLAKKQKSKKAKKQIPNHSRLQVHAIFSLPAILK
jgi:hypothetical protein